MIAKKDLYTFNETKRVLLRENDYIYILPHPALRDRISNYTITFPNPKILPDNYTVIPHGSATLVFFCQQGVFNGNLFGPMSRPCMVGGLANQSELLVIIEFQPAGLSAFTRIPQKELAASVYYSERHLNRIFQNYIGMNTKTFSRLVRLNKAIRLMQNTQYQMTDTSCETGFYDLPHFIHDFKSVCGLTPQEYRNRMSDFYNEIAKF